MEALQRLHNRGSISTGYEIDNSCKFESDNSERLTRTHSSTTNRRTWTVSAWVKRTELNSVQTIISGGKLNDATGVTTLQFNADNTLIFYTHPNDLTTTRVFRDTSAWYHIVWAVDSTQSTAADRVNVYINGVQETSFSTENYPTQNWDSAFNYAIYDTNIGRYAYDNARYFNGYMTDINFIDGSQLAPTEFGEFDEDSGIWIPKAYTGTYGTNGFYLDFADGADLGDDESGNGNDFSEGNLTAADQATDTPTNNFATLNPIHVYSPSALPTISHGATKLTTTYAGWWTAAVSNIAFTSGKWYFEARSATSSTHLSAIGYGDEADIENWGIDTNANRQCHPGRTHSGVASKSFAYIGSDTEGASYGRIFPNGTSPSTRVNYIYTDVIGVAIDADNGYAYWHKNGTYINSGDPTSGSSGTGGYAVPSGTGTNGTLIPSVGAYYHSAIGVIEVNFGGYTEMSISSAASDANGYGTFEYAPPSGYYALCTKNLEEYG